MVMHILGTVVPACGRRPLIDMTVDTPPSNPLVPAFPSKCNVSRELPLSAKAFCKQLQPTTHLPTHKTPNEDCQIRPVPISCSGGEISGSTGENSSSKKRQQRSSGSSQQESHGSASSQSSRGGGRRFGSVSSSSSGNSGDDDDEGEENRRPRRPTTNCKPHSRPRFSTEDEDDERTDSADEDGEVDGEGKEGGGKDLTDRKEAEDVQPSLFTSQPHFSSLGGEDSLGQGYQDHPILKPLSPTSMAVGYGAELSAASQPGGRDGTPTLDSPRLSDGPPSSGILSPEIAISQVTMSKLYDLM